ncbi:olfactory receptor 2AG2-like [Podarcis raffonei]|uniref:olfactory receptor 2AG2-like n=1 Tax=Podarcis raffonei TaxID=65483 RepID=UPI002329933F|nr:olfactory receptor 2AG2-like [Podarcis raffonei]XP_053234727.1 olfactory receptor 2AG2-like [Podarcis raffonei]
MWDSPIATLRIHNDTDSSKPTQEVLEKNNATSWSEFILMGFLSQSKSPSVIMTLFVMMFIMVLSENSLLLYLIHVDSGLHSPMYFFLGQLSVMDISQTLAIGPKMLVDFLRENTISLTGCSAQIFFVLLMGNAECLILAVMSYDRYVAICKPLQYPVLMRRTVCLILTAVVWFCAFGALGPSMYMRLLHYCGSNVIYHIFCDLPSMLKLSCSDTSRLEKTLVFTGFLLLILPSAIILASYVCILATVLRVHSSERSHKALSTCLSHLTVVGLFYGAAMFKYLRPRSYQMPYHDDMVSVFCLIVTPMMNPLIYSLRNRDVLAALRKTFRKNTSCVPTPKW